MLAVVLGVGGMGIYSQFTNLIGLMNFVVPLGLPFSLTKFISEKEIASDEDKKKMMFGSLTLILISSLFVSLILIVFSGNISGLLTGTDEYGPYVIIIAALAPFTFAVALMEALVRGLKQVKLLTGLLISGAIISATVSVAFTLLWGLTGAVISISAGSLAMIAVYISKLKAIGVWELKMSYFKPDRKIVKSFMGLGLASLSIGAINQLSYLSVRIITIDNLGMTSNGIYQSVLGISLNYFSLLFLLVSNYTLPKVNAFREDSQFRTEINDTFRIFNYVLTPLVCIIIVARVIIVNLLYTSEFFPAIDLYKYQFAGDFFKVISWITGLWIIPRNRIRLWIGLEIVTFSLFPLLSLLLIKAGSLNLEAVSISYLAANILHFLMNLFFLKKNINFRIRPENARMFLMSLSVMTTVIIVSEYSLNLGYIMTAPFLIAWFALVSNEDERSLARKLSASFFRYGR